MDTQKLIIAKASFIHTSPRKLRLVANAVRRLDPSKAVQVLRSLPQKAAVPLLRVYQQAISNAKNNFQLSPASLKTISVQIEEGPRGPKKMDKSHGARFDRGIKRRRLSHILVKLTSKEEHGSES